MKKFLLLSIFSLALNFAIAQPASMSKEQQQAFDKAMQQISESIGKLNEALKKLDSMHLENVPPIPPISILPEIEKNVEIIHPEDSDSLHINIGKLKIEIEDGDTLHREIRVKKIIKNDNDVELKNVETKFFGLDIGLNTFLNNSGRIAVPTAYAPLELIPGKSINVNIHLVHQKINLVKHILKLDYGLYGEINNYRFSSDAVLIPKIDSVAFSSEGTAFKKNKLTCTYLMLPVTLDIESNPRHSAKSFHFAAGGYAGLLIGAHTKTVNESGEKIKFHDDFNLNKLRYGVTARVGYGWFSLYANYNLNTLFNDGIQPELTPLSVGIALVGF